MDETQPSQDGLPTGCTDPLRAPADLVDSSPGRGRLSAAAHYQRDNYT